MSGIREILSRQINVPDLGAIPEARQRFLQMSPYPFKPLSVLGDEACTDPRLSRAWN